MLETPEVQEWHHVCLVLSPDLGFYFDGKIVRGITQCKLGLGGPFIDGVDGYDDGDTFSAGVGDGDVSDVTNGVEVVLGGSNWNALPFSGFLADVRVFSRNLTAGEVASVAALSDASPAYFSVGGTPSGSRLASSGVEVSEIEAQKLLEARKPRKYLYFAERTTYAKASDACAKLGGEFLTYSKTGREDLAKNVSEYIDQISVDIDRFWVRILDRNTSDDVCPSVRVGKPTPTLRLDYIPCGMAAGILCQMPEDFKLKVLGLDDDNIFSPSYNAPGTFVSRTKYLLRYANGQIALWNVLSDKVIYERHLGSIEHLLGRSLLREDEEGGPDRTLVLSTCREDQFTCSCGACVSLDDVCNLSLECPDGSDEIYCSRKYELPRNYKKEFSPSMGSRARTQVGLEVVLENVEPLITNQNLLQLSLNVSVVWRDSRLTFSFLEVDRPVRLTEEVFSHFWLPRVVLDTAVEEDKDVFNFRDSPGVLCATARGPGQDAVVGGREGKRSGRARRPEAEGSASYIHKAINQRSIHKLYTHTNVSFENPLSIRFLLPKHLLSLFSLFTLSFISSTSYLICLATYFSLFLSSLLLLFR